MKQLFNSTITGVGAYLPKQKVSSIDLMREIDIESIGISLHFFERATGILERRVSSDEESFTFEAAAASKAAIEDAGIHPLDIDAVYFCGIETDMSEPSTAHDVAKALGTKNAYCCDISNACIGLLSGLDIADSQISCGKYENILICTGERPTIATHKAMRYLEKNLTKDAFRHFMGAFTVGDAGGAFVISRAQDLKSGIVYSRFVTNTADTRLCYYRETPDGMEFGMDMEALSKAMGVEHGKLYCETLSKMKLAPTDITYVFAHQVGAKSHKKLMALTGKDLLSMPATYDHYGNITSATPAVVMSQNRPKPGDVSLLMGAGSGWTINQTVIYHK